MIYDTLARGPDGLYHVKARTDGGKRCLVQLKNVKIIENENGEIESCLLGRRDLHFSLYQLMRYK